jgi:transformation/transcription domain-associated protein
MVEFMEPVPFRLTRNLQTFFTPFGVEGLFVSSMCAAAQAIVAPKVRLPTCHFLAHNLRI